MALSKIQTGLVDTNAIGPTELNLGSNYAFTGTVSGAGRLLQITAIDSATATNVLTTNWTAIAGSEGTVTISATNSTRLYNVVLPGEIDSSAGNVFCKAYKQVDGGSWTVFTTTTNLNFPVGSITNGTVNSTLCIIDTTSYNVGQVIKYRAYIKVQNNSAGLEIGQNNLSGNTGIDNNIHGYVMEYDNS